MSTTDNDAALVAALFAAAQSNTLAMDHLVRMRRDGSEFARGYDDIAEVIDIRDGYVVTRLVQALADAEEAARIAERSQRGSSTQAGLASFAARNVEGSA